MESLADLSELLQDDLLCILDGLENTRLSMVCQAVIDRIYEYQTTVGE